MHIGLITTLNTNIGDDFIREGVCRVMRHAFPDQALTFVPVNKHHPMTVYPRWVPGRWVEALPLGRARAGRFAGRFFAPLGLSRFDDCDLVVQCGAPVFWLGCHRSEWVDPLWHQVIGRLHERVPVLNLAAGSCYPWTAPPQQIDDPNDERFLRAILSYSRRTSVRDPLAQRLCATLGSAVSLIACSALLAATNDQPSPQAGRSTVLINYMEGGGHYNWGQGIDANHWQQTMHALIGRLGKRHNLVLLCHNQAEYALAERLDASLPRLWPRTPADYFAATATAHAAVCNRMHAAVGLAGLGIPSVVIGTDTRMKMTEHIGLPCFYVDDATTDALETALEQLLARRNNERERLRVLQQHTLAQYTTLVQAAVG